MGVKGVFFSTDALIASIILISTIFVFSQLYVQETQSDHLSFLSNDMLNVLSELKMEEINSTYVNTLILSGEVRDVNLTVIEQVGEFWALNKTDLAIGLLNNVTADFFPTNLGYSFLIGNEELVRRDFSTSSNIIAARKMISGYEKSKPIKGSTARAYLTSIQEKKDAAYVYFGGFVGQGNVTVFTNDIPSGVTLNDLEMELDAGGDFNLFINNIQCNTTFVPSGGTMTADRWNISSCLGLLTTGVQNTYKLNFIGDISESFIGGGFIKATFSTDTFFINSTPGVQREWLPQIEGIINLFSSFYVPGTLNNMTMFLHYLADTSNNSNTLYVTIGNETVLRIGNTTGEGNITLTDANFSSFLNYADLSLETIPIRVGFENVTFASVFLGNADVALVTDVSGSMNRRMDSDSTGTARNCGDTNLNLSSTARLSVAKCLDKSFAREIINISGNEVGLISYDDSTHGFETVLPTTDLDTIDTTVGNASPETGYEASGGTCICCGINSASSILTDDISTISLISSGDSWLYNNFSLQGNVSVDPFNRSWYERNYSFEPLWSSSNSVIGSTNGYVYSPNVVSEIGNALSGQALFVDLWEHTADTTGPPLDFSGGILNTTGNTYGLAGASDGWDWDTQDGTGPFGFDDNIDYNNIVGGELSFDSGTGGSTRNLCSSYDCSAAYAIRVTIDNQTYNTMTAGGSATISFRYEWDDAWGNPFGSSDQVWTKARWTSPISGAHFLGSDLDSGDSGSDTDPEIFTRDNPDNDYSGTYSEDISGWIEGPGDYYLELGGKLRAGDQWEYGTWYFDDIELEVSNATDHYYFRKHFNITDISLVQKGILNVLSDDRAIVYINGNLIDTDFDVHDGSYWNRRGRRVDGSVFNVGDNVIAVEVINSNAAAKFDLELLGVNNSRDKAMMVMSDGQATEDSGCPQSGSPSQEAIEAACDAREDYGIQVFAVGYSSNADTTTLDAIAQCGEGIHATSANITALEEFYSDVASSIVSTSRQSQTIEVQGTLTESILYGDSYIEVNFTPSVNPPQFGEIELSFENHNFNNCTFNVSIPSGVRITEALLTSYSSEHWTDALSINGVTVYNLSDYDFLYTGLGDPFIVNIPPSSLQAGNNTFFMRTGDAPDNMTGCSLNNSLIYSGMVSSSVSYSEVLENAEGCVWNIESEDGSNFFATVPPTYPGPDACSYTSSSISYDSTDSVSQAVFELLQTLDFDNNGRVNINIAEEDLEIDALWVSQVPYLWGPAIVEVRVWQ